MRNHETLIERERKLEQSHGKREENEVEHRRNEEPSTSSRSDVAEARRDPRGQQDQQNCSAVNDIDEIENILQPAVPQHLRRDLHGEATLLCSGGLKAAAAHECEQRDPQALAHGAL